MERVFAFVKGLLKLFFAIFFPGILTGIFFCWLLPWLPNYSAALLGSVFSPFSIASILVGVCTRLVLDWVFDDLV